MKKNELFSLRPPRRRSRGGGSGGLFPRREKDHSRGHVVAPVLLFSSD